MLFDVLSNRACVNVLKILHDNETSGKTSYSLKKSDIVQMIKNKDALESIYQKYEPSDCIHFAAETHVDNSISNPHIFTDTNIV